MAQFTTWPALKPAIGFEAGWPDLWLLLISWPHFKTDNISYVSALQWSIVRGRKVSQIAYNHHMYRAAQVYTCCSNSSPGREQDRYIYSMSCTNVICCSGSLQLTYRHMQEVRPSLCCYNLLMDLIVHTLQQHSTRWVSDRLPTCMCMWSPRKLNYQSL